MKKKSIYIIIIIVIVLIATGTLFYQKQGHKFTTFYQYQSIPDIELVNTLYKTNGRLVGRVAGFVKFNDIEDQPRDARQYYIISSTNNPQNFSLDEIIKLEYLSPTNIGTTNLSKVNETDLVLILEDEGGSTFSINKATGQVYIKDIDGDETTLITNQNDYKNYMKEFLNI